MIFGGDHGILHNSWYVIVDDRRTAPKSTIIRDMQQFPTTIINSSRLADLLISQALNLWKLTLIIGKGPGKARGEQDNEQYRKNTQRDSEDFLCIGTGVYPALPAAAHLHRDAHSMRASPRLALDRFWHARTIKYQGVLIDIVLTGRDNLTRPAAHGIHSIGKQ